jgi:hypothetical protein
LSNALAISAVSAVLQSMLYSVYNSAGLGTVTVSAVAPDLAQSDATGGNDAALMVNLFMHQVTYNAAWRNVGFPSLSADGSTPLKNPPLPLDLHYLLTAYATVDFQAEALLGFGIQMLHQNPVLTRAQITNALNSGLTLSDPSNPLLGVLGTSGLADQIEMIKVTPATLGREEMAWLWTALKADYRPTFPFQVSVVLIQSQAPTASALPVLKRSISAQAGLAPAVPTLSTASPPNSQPAACLGDLVTVTGSGLAAAATVTLANARLGVEQTISPLATLPIGSSFTFTVPSPPPATPPTDIPAGVYLLTAQVPSGSDTLTTNGLSFAIAPQIASSWVPGPIASGSSGVLTVPCTPFLRPSQEISLLIGGQEIPVDPFTTATNSPSFSYDSLQPTGGPVPAWLRVDGVDSPIINMTSLPTPTFSGPMVTVT